MARRPNETDAEMAKEIDKVEKQLDAIDDQLKNVTLDTARAAPKQDVEPQNRLSSSDIDKTKDVYLKPKRSISSKEKFNEKYRERNSHKVVRALRYYQDGYNRAKTPFFRIRTGHCWHPLPTHSK